METQVFIDALGQALGQQVEKDGEGAYAFLLDGVPVLLHSRPADSSFLLHMEIGYPTGLGGGVLAKLLGANFLLSETMGAAISLDERTGMVFLEHPVFLPGLDGAGFVARVEGFVALADVWTRRLREWNDEIETVVSGRLDDLQRSLEGQADGIVSPEASSSLLRV
jgi:hypothetical protein